MPYVASEITGIQNLLISATSILIVGVAVDTMRQLEAQLVMRNHVKDLSANKPSEESAGAHCAGALNSS